MTQPPDLKIAFVGCGHIAQAHWRGIQARVPRLQVTAVVDVDPARAAQMAEQTGARPYTSLETALDQGHFEAVDILLPHHLHEQAALRAFAAGKHVVLEKPMATTLESCNRIIAAAREASTVFMVAEQSQYSPKVVKVQQLIRDGVLGEIITARAAFVGGVSRARGSNPWRFDKRITGGGISIDGGSHWIRPLRMWLGEIDEVVAVLDYPHKEMEGESLAHALLRFRSNKFAVFEALRAGSVRAPGESFRVTGTDGIVVIESGRAGRALHYSPDFPQGRDLLAEAEARETSFGLELADFARAVLDGTELAAGPEESLGELRTALAIYRSAESRQWEKVWD